MKVLHIVESLDRGAVENWLIRMLRFGKEQGRPFDWTFYCVLERNGELADEVRSLGAEVVHSPAPLKRTTAFARALRGRLRSGHYDVVHCHHDLVSAVYLLASFALPIRCRIVHVHNADEFVPTPNKVKAELLRPVLRTTCLVMADQIVGISNHTLDSFLAGRCRRPGRDMVHYYGIDPSPLEIAADRQGFRTRLDLPVNCPILLFAGRIVPEKNPIFAVEVFAALRRLAPNAACVFVGTGSLQEAACRRAAELGVGATFRYLGWRGNVPAIMACCDWFILPRPETTMEGFGLAIVEAQLAGLRLLLSRAIPDDPLLPTALYARLGLVDGPDAWARAAQELMAVPAVSPLAIKEAFLNSQLNPDFAVRDLHRLYSDCTGNKLY